MIVNFHVPNTVAQELNTIATENGFSNAKAMVIAYLKHTIKANRVKISNLDAIREKAEKQADIDTTDIT